VTAPESSDKPSVIYQAAKLGDVACLLAEFGLAQTRLRTDGDPGRVYGVSGGAFLALAAGLEWAARARPERWHAAGNAIPEFGAFLETAPSRALRTRNLNPWYGPFHLGPLRSWVAGRLRRTGRRMTHGSPTSACRSFCVRSTGTGRSLCSARTMIGCSSNTTLCASDRRAMRRSSKPWPPA
jgi:drug/metabolite transporter superfamily protein YnfA